MRKKFDEDVCLKEANVQLPSLVNERIWRQPSPRKIESAEVEFDIFMRIITTLQENL